MYVRIKCLTLCPNAPSIRVYVWRRQHKTMTSRAVGKRMRDMGEFPLVLKRKFSDKLNFFFVSTAQIGIPYVMEHSLA